MRIAALVIETAFSDGPAGTSAAAMPFRARPELARLDHPTNVYITHIKPGEVDAVMRKSPHSTVPIACGPLIPGQVIAID
jgi:hypothetical protein